MAAAPQRLDLFTLKGDWIAGFSQKSVHTHKNVVEMCRGYSTHQHLLVVILMTKFEVCYLCCSLNSAVCGTFCRNGSRSRSRFQLTSVIHTSNICRILFAILCLTAAEFILVPAVVLRWAVISVTKSGEQARVNQERVKKDSDFCVVLLLIKAE